MDKQTKFNELINSINLKYQGNVIGVLSEKTLHKTIKNFYEANQLCQEVKIDGYYVDILNGNNIIEVQTKQFNKLVKKINYLLSLNKYKINIVYPVFTNKIFYNCENNMISEPKKSPKKLKYPEIFYELYKIKTLLNHKDLKITLLLLEINEYRQINKSRKGYELLDRVPTRFVDEIILDNNNDYLKLLPNNLPLNFCTHDLVCLTKCNIKYVSRMVNVMKYLKIIDVIGKEGRKYIYSIKKG